MLLWQLTHLSHWAQVNLIRLSWPRQRAVQPNPNNILWNRYEQGSIERFSAPKGETFFTRFGGTMDRNILSVAMMYTNYDPKPHPPGGNIRPVIQATNYIKLHRPLRHPISGHFPHRAFKRRKYVSPDYDFHPTTNHHLPMNKEKRCQRALFFSFFAWNFFMFLFFGYVVILDERLEQRTHT